MLREVTLTEALKVGKTVYVMPEDCSKIMQLDDFASSFRFLVDFDDDAKEKPKRPTSLRSSVKPEPKKDDYEIEEEDEDED